jgi:hypothetical protein
MMRHTLVTDQFTTLTVVYAVPTTPGHGLTLVHFSAQLKRCMCDRGCV